MSKELFFIGAPAKFKTGVQIYPPSVKEVIVNNKYTAFTKVLTYSQEEIEDIFVKEKKDLTSFPTPIEFLLNNCYHDAQYEQICKESCCIGFFIGHVGERRCMRRYRHQRRLGL